MPGEQPLQAPESTDENETEVADSEEISTRTEEAKEHRDDEADGIYTIHSAVNQSYVLDISGGSKSNGANIQLYQSNGTGAQRWEVDHNAKGYLTITDVVR